MGSDFSTGMSALGRAMSAVVSNKVTLDAQADRIARGLDPVSDGSVQDLGIPQP